MGLASQRVNSATVYPRITKFCRDIHAKKSKATPDTTSPATSGRQLSKFEKRQKILRLIALDWISPEQFLRGSWNFTHLSGTIGLTNLPDMTSIAPSSRLPNAIQYCKKVGKTLRPAKSRIIQPLFRIESPNFIRTSTPTQFTTTSNMTSSTTCYQHFSQFEKQPKMQPPTGFFCVCIITCQVHRHTRTHRYMH